jgi:phage baseplate assembly protein W
MASGFSPKLPLQHSDEDGQALTKTAREAIKQNMKMIVLTAPGERVMDPSFGVGLRRFLFRPLTNQTFEIMATAIRSQITKYMPYIKFRGINIQTADQDYSLGNNGIRITVSYAVPAIGQSDELVIVEKAGIF